MTLDPTIPKVVIIACLLFIEGFLIPTYTIIAQNRWPTMLEFCGFFLAALLQLITFLITFVETGSTQVPKA